MEITVPVSSIVFSTMEKGSLKAAMKRIKKEFPIPLIGTKSSVLFVRPHRNGGTMVGIRVKVQAHRDDVPLLTAIRNKESDTRVCMMYKGFSRTNRDTNRKEIIVRSILGFYLNTKPQAEAKRQY